MSHSTLSLIVCLVALVAVPFASGAKFYVGQQYTPSNLFIYDTETSELNHIGRVLYQGGDIHLTSLYWDEEAGRLFGFTSYSPPRYGQSVVEINPTNANGMLSVALFPQQLRCGPAMATGKKVIPSNGR
jgi:hypothetical protein